MTILTDCAYNNQAQCNIKNLSCNKCSKLIYAFFSNCNCLASIQEQNNENMDLPYWDGALSWTCDSLISSSMILPELWRLWRHQDGETKFHFRQVDMSKKEWSTHWLKNVRGEERYWWQASSTRWRGEEHTILWMWSLPCKSDFVSSEETLQRENWLWTVGQAQTRRSHWKCWSTHSHPLTKWLFRRFRLPLFFGLS